MAVTNRYKGDCRCGFTSTTYTHERRLRTVNDGSAMSDKSFEMDAGASVTFYYKRTNGITNAPNKTTIEVRYEMGATVVRSFLAAGAEPADGAPFTFYSTSDGTVSGSPRAGTYRFYMRSVLDNSAGGLTNYDVDTDGTFGTFGTAYVLPTGTADSGCLRGNTFVTALTANSYLSGSKFKYADAITLTATHTQKFAATGVETVRLDVTDSSDVQQLAGTASAIDAGTSFTQNFTVGNNFPIALSSNDGIRFLPIGDSAFVPTSGAIPWTKFVASGVTQDGNNVKRSSVFNVDPRLTINQQAQGASSTRTGGSDKTAYVISADQLFVWAQTLDANGGNVGSITMTQQLLASDATTVLVQDTTQITQAGNGWTPDPGRDFTSFVSAPSGNRTQKSFPNAPSNAVGLGTATRLLGFSSAFTANRGMNIVIPDEAGIGIQQTINFEYLQSDGTRVTLDSAPSVRVYSLSASGVQVDDLALTTMTQYSGQQCWSKAWTPTAAGVYSVEVRAPVAGAIIESARSITVRPKYTKAVAGLVGIL